MSPDADHFLGDVATHELTSQQLWWQQCQSVVAQELLEHGNTHILCPESLEHGLQLAL